MVRMEENLGNHDPGYIAAKDNARAKYKAWDQAQTKTIDFIRNS